jgi:hypothetical protein
MQKKKQPGKSNKLAGQNYKKRTKNISGSAKQAAYF